MAMRQRRFPKFVHSPKIVIIAFAGFLLVALWFFGGRSTGGVAPSGTGAALQQQPPGFDGGDDDSFDRKSDQVGGLVDDNKEVDQTSGDTGGKTGDETSVNDEKGDDAGKVDETGDGDAEGEAGAAEKGDETGDGDAGGEAGAAGKGDETGDAGKGDETWDADTQTRDGGDPVTTSSASSSSSWKLCSSTDYIPCLDNEEAIKMLPSRHHFEHRERHCPKHEDLLSCLVPLPESYKRPVTWPQSRDEIWFDNVPHPGLVTYKQDQSWVKRSGDRLTFPGTGTQFILGADHYIDYIQKSFQEIEWGKRTRVVLDVGCGVASFGGYLFSRDVLTMSFAPKDEHEAQVQLALERGIPAISSVMGTQRLVFPANVFDMVHCARCRVPWHDDGGKLLLEVNRLLRPGGLFVWSAPPVYRKQPDQVAIWKNTSSLAAAMCWNQVARTMDNPSGVGAVIFQKPLSNSCYENRRSKYPPLCDDEDVRDAAWYIPMKSCVHKVPTREEHGNIWPEDWPQRLQTPPAWLTGVSKGVYGKPMLEEFTSDTEHWKHVVQNSYLRSLKIDWSGIRNVMDMKAAYGGFAAALVSKPLWVLNIVPIYEPDTLAVIFDRGLLGMYHDWCESFSTYPRTYDLLHADHLLTKLTKRCNATVTLVEMDRILRPEGYIIFRDKVENLSKFKPVMDSLHWEVHLSHTQGAEELLVMQKQWWRPQA